MRGGAEFAQALSKAGLIDEYVILTRPIAYGGGKPLFSGLTDALNVLVTAAYDNGTMLRIYAPR
ncbi:dihydrofolate reductase family protein [Mesorhizobium sp. CA15]|uniref:dihydrofolate reductase family protein n=1 Tax=unclassified Mesorhizobium TaxID=325217 RepID=UPI001CD00B19|nr:dihydrofolate reductase family protein [Mesorhizobium sp. CA7]MBZ9816461.1 dihydrofolate reductase family protein [Mesorhizobium sp. CA7]MBZ9868458.1 dihydrofolate reductase family protein [Mesorhizobium sp. CA15]